MNISLLSKRLVAVSIIMAMLLALAACSSSDDDNPPNPAPNNDVSYIFPIAPSQEVPPVTTADNATGEGNLVVDSVTGAISGSASVSGLTGQASMAHIHQAAAGENGDVLITLEGNTDGTVWTVPAGTVLDTPQLAALTAGNMYINVHTAANPGGEVRGQIVLAAP